jgi:hypothetical protein
MCDNTSEPRPAQSPPPRFPWPPTGPTEDYLIWQDWLRLMANAIDRLAGGGEPGHWLGNLVMGAAEQAKALGATSPIDHETKAQIESERESDWIAALEAEAAQAGCWVLSEPEPDSEATGALDGHPADEAGPMQAWLGDPSCDDTYMN